MENKQLAKTNIHKKAMILALEKTLGIVSSACEIAGIARTTHYEWCIEDPEYKKEVDSVKDRTLDFAESKLLESIKNGSDTATIFYLKTQGKKRGYIEKQELEHSGVIDQQVFIIGGVEVKM